MIIIRSVGRAKTMTTIDTLKRLNTKLPIKILVKKEEYDEYIFFENENTEVIINPLGSRILEQNRYALTNFGEFIALLDDDITSILKCESKDNPTLFNFDEFFNDAVNLLKKEELDVYATEHTGNTYFTQNKIVKGLYTYSGLAIFRCADYLTEGKTEEYEDIEKCLLSYKNGKKIIKDYRYCVKHKMNVLNNKNKGGMDWDRKDNRLSEANILKEEYPDLISIKPSKTFVYNIVLNRKEQNRAKIQVG